MWVRAAAGLVLVVVAALLWRGSAAAATVSTTAAPAGVLAGTPAGSVSPAWSARTVAGAPDPAVHGGRVVVLGEHGVRALDVRDGAEAWRYTRADAALCDATVVDGLVVAVFRGGHRCDEAVALSVDTGVRAWTRNVDFRSDVRLTGSRGVVLAVAPPGVAVLDPAGSALRWRQAADPGCAITGAETGEAGVALLQRCDGRTTLRLLDGAEGGQTWTREVPDPQAALAGVDRLVVVAGTAGTTLHAAQDGEPVGRLEHGGGPVLVGGSGEVVLVAAGGTLSAVDGATGGVRWAVPATGLPAGAVGVGPDAGPGSAPGTGSGAVPGDGSGGGSGGGPGGPVALPVPGAGGFVLRDRSTGADVGRSTAAPASGGLVTVAGPVVVQQLPGRVVGWR